MASDGGGKSRLWLWAWLCLLGVQPVVAKQAWITDKLEVPLRNAPNVKGKALHPLFCGSPLTISDKPAKNGFTRVTLPTGEEGWMPTRQISFTPPSQDAQPPRAQPNAKLAESIPAPALPHKDNALPQSAEERTVEALLAEIARLNSELIAVKQASANIIQIQTERDTLTEEKRTLVSELDMLKREKLAQDASGKQNWFIMGAGVLFFGVVLGVMLPRLNWRKKSQWETF